jgi:hypothetical protein
MKLSLKDKILMLVLPLGSAILLYGALASEYSWWPF